MHPDEFQNWKTIKETFEENGTTDNYYYKRACAIIGQEMIDKSIDKHNKTATIISAILGGILLAFYSHGVLSLVGRV